MHREVKGNKGEIVCFTTYSLFSFFWEKLLSASYKLVSAKHSEQNKIAFCPQSPNNQVERQTLIIKWSGMQCNIAAVRRW